MHMHLSTLVNFTFGANSLVTFADRVNAIRHYEHVSALTGAYHHFIRIYSSISSWLAIHWPWASVFPDN